MNILVTGATGLIGSRIVKGLLYRGDMVTGLSRSGKVRYSKQIVKHSAFRLIKCDLGQKQDLFCQIPQVNYDAVIHCASQQPRKGLGYTAYHQANVQAIDHLLDWMKESGIQKVISLSTVVFHAFPEHGEAAYNEKAPVDPQDFYALTKYAGEQLLKVRTNLNGFHVICLRLPSVFLEEQIGGIVHTYYEHAVEGRDLELYSGGKYKRNLVYIDDVFQGILKSLDRIDSIKGFNVFLLGSEQSWSMKEIAEYIYRKTKSSGKIIPASSDAPVKGHWVLDLTAARENLGFRPAKIEKSLDLYIDNMSGG